MRLDLYLTEAGIAETRSKAKAMISAGEIYLAGKPCTKPAQEVDCPEITVIPKGTHYVGRGGNKLEAALGAFSVDCGNAVACDIGASTGGFTDCLLKNGARRVYAVDTGRDQLHPSLRADSRVVSMEQTNARELTPQMLGEACDLCVMDVSFISQSLLYPAVSRILKEDGAFLSLVKPQFEAGRAHVGKGGLVRDDAVHADVLHRLITLATGAGLYCRGVIRSPIEGGDGNREYLAYFGREASLPLPEVNAMLRAVKAGRERIF